MKKIWVLCAGFSAFWAMCEQYPSNPNGVKAESPSVVIRHVSTEYLPAQSKAEGVVATKVNVLTFEIKMRNGSAQGMEFYGSALLGGPPDERKHAFLFRTDWIDPPCSVPGVVFNTIDRLDPEIVYTLVRAQFPSNEYYPFDGEQGKMLDVDVTDAWALENEDEKSPLVLVQAVEGPGR